MKSDVAYEFAIEVVVAQPAVLPVAHQNEWLVVTRIHSHPMATIALPICISLARKARLVIAGLIKPENARVPIAIGNVN